MISVKLCRVLGFQKLPEIFNINNTEASEISVLKLLIQDTGILTRQPTSHDCVGNESGNGKG
jgi:hypothetical protein